jgi:hypothetical protein
MPKLTRTSLGFVAVAAVATSLWVVPAVASAQDPLANPSAAQYNPPIPNAGGVSGSTGAGAGQVGGAGGAAAEPSVAQDVTPGGKGGSSSNLGSLPFTGMDLIIVAGVALLLTGTGLALRRLSLPRDPQV